MEDLNNALNYLHEEHHTILETYQGDFESVLVNAHVDEDTATTIASNSLALRIAQDTLHSYMSLINHLAGVNNTRGWEACQTQLQYHVGKLSQIRGKYHQ